MTLSADATSMEFGATLVRSPLDPSSLPRAKPSPSFATSRLMALGAKSPPASRGSPTAVTAAATGVDDNAFEEEAGVSPSTADSSSVDAHSDAVAAAAAELSFEPSKNFFFSSGFGASTDDIFASTATDFSVAEDELAEEENNVILPPHVVSPTNQTSEDEDTDETDAVENAISMSRPRAIHAKVASRRKNSIEMFLSQSPSQALGGEFLKMSLDDHRARRGDGRPHPPPMNQATPDLEREPTPDRTKAETSSYRGYLTAPSSARASAEMDAREEWNGAEVAAVASPRGYYYDQPQQMQAPVQQAQPHLGRYYSTGGGAGNGSGPALYRQSSLDAYALSPTHEEMMNVQQQWHAGANHAAYGQQMPAVSGYPQMHQQYQPQQFPGAIRAPNRSFVRSQSLSSGRFSRSPPLTMMEASPPHSPRHQLSMSGSNVMFGNVGTKQCKFFLQGHCRMGNKCKFSHQTSMMYPPSVTPQFAQSYNGAPSMPMNVAEHEVPHHLGAFTRSSSARSLSSYRMNDMQVVGSGHLGHSASGHPVGLHGSFVATDTILQPEDVQGRVFAMSKDQNGCRLLQEQLEYCDERKPLCDVIYSEAMEHLAEMMVDPFGNYLFQKLLERAKPLQRLEIIRRVSGNLVAAALNLHGTRSVQKVVEVCANSSEVVELDSDGHELRRVSLPDVLVDALKDDAVRLCIDSNGNHVIQRALQFMKPEYNQFVFDAVCLECTTVGTHRHGCCVLQRCLDAADAQQKRDVIQQVEKQAMKLMQDPYGNYVVQYVLDSCDPEEARGVIVKPLGSIYDLSIQKFSSNVIEKCLEKAPSNVLAQYIDEITTCPRLQKMLQDQFANYVVQRALCVANEDQCLALVQAIRPHLSAMRNTSGGRRITARILKRFPHMDLSMELGYEPALPGLLMRSNTTGSVATSSMFGTSGLTYMPNGMGLGLRNAGGNMSQL